MLEQAILAANIGHTMPSQRDDPDPIWLSARQVASLLGISTEQVRRLSRTGAIPSIKIGGALRFKRSVIENLDELPPD